MDLERIKQNLRLRSGRNKKTRKPVIQKSTDNKAKASEPDQKPRQESETPNKQPNGHVKEDTSQSTPVKSQPEQGALQSQDINIAQIPAHRPELPHASTGNAKATDRRIQSDRYGRSGLERPRKSPLNNAPSAPQPLQRTMTEPKNLEANESSDALDFDLKPAPAYRRKPTSIEELSELLFSADHLNSILHDPNTLKRFTTFLSKYKPQYHPVLLRYLETQKAIKAIEYANAVAEGIEMLPEEDTKLEKISFSIAASLDKAFEKASTTAYSALVGTALPLYVTYNLVKIVSECLANEITGRQTPLMRNLVGGLSEVFCITDPNIEDNPIIYASEEFYRLTGYGPDDVIDHNCRFLQGARTKRESVARLKASIKKGEEICETLLNFRRDGRPFINLLMIAPLHDNNGNLKYHIGAQVEVSGLVEDGRGLQSFERFINSRKTKKQFEEAEDNFKTVGREEKRNNKALGRLRELSEMFDLEEAAVVQSHSRSNSISRNSDERSIGSNDSRRAARRVYMDSEDSEENDSDGEEPKPEDSSWKLGTSGPHGPSGKLPGVYDTYMLIRPAPSLRIIFVSPKLRRLGSVVQSRFLSHVAANPGSLKGLKESFEVGVPVSAKINFSPTASENRYGTKLNSGSKQEEGRHGKTCWISATPLFGGDDKIGVWMIIFIEKNRAARRSENLEKEATKADAKMTDGQDQKQRPNKIDIPARRSSIRSWNVDNSKRTSQAVSTQEDMPIKPVRLDSETLNQHNAQMSSGVEGLSSPPEEEFERVPKSTEDPNLNSPVQDSDPRPNHDEELSEKHVVDGEPGDSEKLANSHDSHHGLDLNSELAPPATEERSDPTVKDYSADHRSASAERPSTPPSEIPPSVPSSAQIEDRSDFEETPTKAFHDSNERSPTPSPHQANHDQGTALGKPSEMKYMDYLRHPGSQKTGEYGNKASGNRFANSKHDALDEEKDGSENLTDLDCMRSPYSVD